MIKANKEIYGFYCVWKKFATEFVKYNVLQVRMAQVDFRTK